MALQLAVARKIARQYEPGFDLYSPREQAIVYRTLAVDQIDLATGLALAETYGPSIAQAAKTAYDYATTTSKNGSRSDQMAKP